MSDFSEITRIANAENYEQLQKTKSEEIAKVHKMELMLSILKNAELNSLKVDDKSQLKKAIRNISHREYTSLNNGKNILGLDECEPAQLSYTERNAIRNYVIENIVKSCSPPVKFFRETERKIPSIFDTKENQMQEILELETDRRQLFLDLLEKRNQVCNLLKVCIEMKMGPHLQSSLEVLLTEYKLIQLKATRLQGIVCQDLFMRSEHTAKAFKEVEEHIDAELAKNGMSSHS